MSQNQAAYNSAGPDKARDTTPVGDQLLILERAIHNLNGQLTTLENKLYRVLAPTPPQSGETAGRPTLAVVQSRVLETLVEFHKQVDAVAVRVVQISERLEV